MRLKLIILGILVCSFCEPPCARAQIVFGQEGYFSASLIYAGWSVKDSEETKLEEWVSVVRVFWPVADNLEVSLFTTGAIADLTKSASAGKRLSGLNDTRIQGAYSFAEDTFLLTVGLNFPTGKNALNEDELEISRVLADNSLRFPVRTYGEGLDVSAGLATAQKLGKYIFGLGGGYLLKGEYLPLESTPHKYKPGDELTLCLGLDLTGERTLLRLDGIYTHFMKDSYGGEEVFQKGEMYEIEARWVYEGERANSSAGVKTILRGKDRLANEDGCYREEHNSHRNEYRGDLNLGIGLSRSSMMRVLFEIRALDANQYPELDPLLEDESIYYGGGAGFCLGIGKRTSLDLAGKYLVGKAGGDTKDLTGINARIGIAYMF